MGFLKLHLKGTSGGEVHVVSYAAVKTNQKTRAGNKSIHYYCTVTYLEEDEKGEKETYEISKEIYEQLTENIDISCKFRNTIIEIIEILN